MANLMPQDYAKAQRFEILKNLRKFCDKLPPSNVIKVEAQN